jgi:hypothetical protein
MSALAIFRKKTCRSGSDPRSALTVTPAKAGAQAGTHGVKRLWAPAFAGVTKGAGNLPPAVMLRVKARSRYLPGSLNGFLAESENSESTPVPVMPLIVAPDLIRGLALLFFPSAESSPAPCQARATGVGLAASHPLAVIREPIAPQRRNRVLAPPRPIGALIGAG